MENITIEKLNEAINHLMTAYEELKVENKELKQTIESLEDENKNLESNINNLSDTKEQQSSTMNTIFNKIESILPTTKTTLSQQEVQKQEVHTEPLDFTNDISIEKEEDKKPELDSKIDLGRMNNLLNGLSN